MAHLVLGYPSLAESIRTAEQYIASGVAILELQIPFSHPTADGPVITLACQKATQEGVTVSACLEAIQALRTKFPKQEIMAMSYLNRIYHYGFQAFMDQLKALGIKNLIVPDLPADAIRDFAVQHNSVHFVPVLAANTTDARLDQLLALDFDFYYLMSDFKITGSGFSLHPRLKEIIQKIRAKAVHRPRIGIGFGISTPEQARIIVAEADVAIIGSVLIQAQNAGKLEEYLESLQQEFNTP
jgi:tryptophan synthase alpha chain